MAAKMMWNWTALLLATSVAGARAEETFWLESELALIDRGLELINCQRADLSFQKRPIDDSFRLAVVDRVLDDPLALGAEMAAWDARAIDPGGVRALLVEAARALPEIPFGAHLPRIESIALLIDQEGKWEHYGAGEIFAVVPGHGSGLYELLQLANELRDRAARAFAPLGERRDALLAKALGAMIEEPGIAIEAVALEDPEFLELLQKVDRVALARLGRALDIGLKLAESLAAARPEGGYEFRGVITAETPLGRVLLYGVGDDVHPADENAALVIDLGGNDTWLQGASASVLWDRPIAIAIDVAGDDRYVGGAPLSFGAALGGVALQWDGGGNDVWIAGHASLGTGILGAGVLYEGGGDDVMRGGDLCEGAGAFGVGLLLDVAGNDYRHAALFGQGCATTWGAGILVDRAGHDVYDAGSVHSDAPLHRDRTQSLSQGFAIGMRPHASGGVGVLVDVAGNDRYCADIYGQGASYWYSLGLLIDGDGNDTYALGHYGQGAGIHLSAGMLFDRAGQDLYYTEYGVGIGGAHDFAVGILLDRAGDDHYCGSGGSQGGALTNSVAILLDGGGDDGYTAVRVGSSHGSAAPARDTGGIGLFLDAGGKDMYSESVRDTQVWISGSIGAGLDESPAPDQAPPADPMAAEISEADARARVDAEGMIAGTDGEPPRDDLDKLWEIAIRWQVGDERVIGPIARARLVALGAPTLDRAIERLGSSNGLELECVQAILALFPHDEVTTRLLAATRADVVAVRRSAVRFLGALVIAEAASRLVEMLADDEVRTQSLRALAALGQAPPEVAGYVRAAKELEGVAAIACLAAAAKADASAGESVEDSVAALIGALDPETPYLVRAAAIAKLAELGATATPSLATAASDSSSNPRIRRAALTALGESRTAPAADPILALLSDSDPWLRLTAHQAAARLALDLALVAADAPSTQAATQLAAARAAARATETDPLILRLR